MKLISALIDRQSRHRIFSNCLVKTSHIEWELFIRYKKITIDGAK